VCCTGKVDALICDGVSSQLPLLRLMRVPVSLLILPCSMLHCMNQDCATFTFHSHIQSCRCNTSVPYDSQLSMTKKCLTYNNFSACGNFRLTVAFDHYTVMCLHVFVQILFYCHFPDKLLCVDRSSLLKRCYRAPLDYIEEITTGQLPLVAVGSR
jgi:hypothetical protein